MGWVPGRCLIAAAVLAALTGCGPSRGQILFYELELSLASFGVVCLLMWLGRVLCDSRVWFVCSYCLKPNARDDVRDGTMTNCTHCGRATSVNELPADQVRRVAPAGRLTRVRLIGGTRLGRLLLAFVLALAFQGFLVVAGLGVVYLLSVGEWPGFDKHGPWHEIAFPFVFALGCEADGSIWWLFNWLLVVSYHLGWAVRELLDRIPFVPWALFASPGHIITMTLVQLGLWWFLIVLGCRQRARWWLVPTLVGGVNGGVAIAAYIMEWDL